MTPDDVLPFNQIILEKLPARLDRELPHGVTVRQLPQYEHDKVRLQFETYVWGQKDSETVLFEVFLPATWWDHFKFDHPRLARWLRLSAPRTRSHTETRVVRMEGRFPEMRQAARENHIPFTWTCGTEYHRTSTVY